MDYENFKKIIKDMENSKLTSLEIEFPDGTKIKMKKDLEDNRESSSVPKAKKMVNVEEKNDVKEEKVIEDENINIVKSPMIGTFYAKPSPEANPYVNVGDKVKKGDVLCIIEAMKLMNEIECEFDGVITEILVENGKPVDYGKPLFKIK